MTEISGAGCGLHSWQGQSTVTHATATSVMGPYTKRSTAVPHQAHNPQAIRHGGKWYIFHIGGGNTRKPPVPCNETLPPPLLAPGPGAAGSATAATCPAAPPGYTRREHACIARANCAGQHCNCAAAAAEGACTGGDVGACLVNATAFCDAASWCRSVVLRTTGCAPGTAVRWMAFRLASGSTAPNPDWTAYTKPGPPGPPVPPGPPPPGPPPPGPPPPPPGSSVHVADSPFGPFRPLEVSGPPLHCNNPSPAVHPNGTLFVACTWFLMSAATPAGPWTQAGPIQLRGKRGAWEDPFLFFDRRGGWHVVAHVYSGTPGSAPGNNLISGHAYSSDGIEWAVSVSQPYSNVVPIAGGGGQTFATLERPKLMFGGSADPHRPVALFNGASPWWDAGAAASGGNACGACLGGRCVMCKVTCQARGAAADIDWTYTLGRPVSVH